MQLSIEEEARELLHGIEILTRCLQLRGTHQARRRKWMARIRKARADLEALFAGGLDRDFRAHRDSTKAVLAGPH